MKQKILLVAAVVAAGTFAWTRPHYAPPADLRDAVADTALRDLRDIQGSAAPMPDTPQATAPRPAAAEAVVLVHGYGPLWDEYVPLERELTRRGYSVLRFYYDHTQSLEVSADELVSAVQGMRAWLPAGKVRIIAHSMGGLVARRALTAGREATLAGSDMRIELVTIASPFGGFKSANAMMLAPFNIFGLKESFRYLGSATKFITEPGRLGDNVAHYKYETDERGRRRLVNGESTDDSVVLPPNQANAAVDGDSALKRKAALAAGHVGVISDDYGRVSPQLIGVLDELFPPLR